MRSICKGTKKFLGQTMERFHQFDLWDVAVFKMCLISLGILIGSRFVKPLKKMRWLIWALFGASYLYIIWRMFMDE